jgi:hypothetical protein
VFRLLPNSKPHVLGDNHLSPFRGVAECLLIWLLGIFLLISPKRLSARNRISANRSATALGRLLLQFDDVSRRRRPCLLDWKHDWDSGAFALNRNLCPRGISPKKNLRDDSPCRNNFVSIRTVLAHRFNQELEDVAAILLRVGSNCVPYSLPSLFSIVHRSLFSPSASPSPATSAFNL